MRNSLTLVPRLLVLSVLSSLAAAPQPALALDEFTVAKDTVVVWVKWAERGQVNRVKVWIPQMEFILYGPPSQGSVFWFEAGLPGKKKWLSYACDGKAGIGDFSDQYRDAAQATLIWCRDDVDYSAEKLGTTYTGMADFSIHMRNELQGISDVTLFTGKFKVAKKPARGAVRADDIDFYVDEDWRIPIAYLTPGGDAGGLRADLSFRKSLGAAMAYLFYQGKQLEEVSCDEAGVPLSKYGLVDVRKCQFWSVSRKANPYRPTEKKHLLNAENPGEYEIKVMADGRLVRSLKFTVDAEGIFDNGTATAGKLGTLGVVVPVKVLGTADGVWNKLSWKTDAFYGNPLTGFTALP